MQQALGLVEIKGWSPAMVALDAMTKAADVALLQVELNDLYGACIKFTGATANVQAAVAAGRAVAEQMHVDVVTRRDHVAGRARRGRRTRRSRNSAR